MSTAVQSTTKPVLPALLPSTAGKLVPHALPGAAVVRFFGTDPAVGFSSLEVAQQRAKYGPNSIQSIRLRPAWRLLIDQFASVVIALLAVATFIAWATGDVIEATAI